MIGNIRQLSSRIAGQQFTIFTRSIYLHKGPRVEGLKRDPEAAFINPKGIKYGLNETNISHIKSFLGDKYNIPDEIALQVITHKSFGNGIKPYNEKLAAMGSKLLSLYFAKYVTNQPCKHDNGVEGKNLDVLGSPMSRELPSLKTAAIFAKSNNINEIMFWHTRNSTLGFESSGELKVSGELLFSLVGAVNFYHGKNKAEQFITEKLVDQFEKISAQNIRN